jgi:outer membrane protein assembly factor BamB
MALHDNRHSATATVDGPASGHVQWTRDLGGNITPGPAIGADGSIYVSTNAGLLYALNPADGTTRWSLNGGGAVVGGQDLSTTSLVLPSGVILWPGPSNTLFAVSSAGKELWSHSFTSAPLSPVLTGTRVYVEQANGTLTALNVAGAIPSIVWSLRIGKTSYGSAVVAPNGNIVTTADRHVIDVVDQGSSGRVKWRFTTSSELEVSPSVGPNGVIEVSTNDRHVYAITAAGHEKWSTSFNKESYSSLSISNGDAYYGDNKGTLRVVNAGTGKPIVSDQGVGDLWGAQAIDAKRDVYFGTQGKHIYGFNAQGKQLFDVAASGRIDSYPALTGNGDLIIGDESGTLYDIG